MSSATRREMSVDRARYTDLPRLREFVAETCAEARAADAVRDALELAVDEACTNIIEHGYPPGEPGPVRVAVEWDLNEIRVHIDDRGRPFPPERAPAADTSAGWARRAPGGLGWHLIRTIVTAVRYDTDAGGINHLTLVKRKSPASHHQGDGR